MYGAYACKAAQQLEELREQLVKDANRLHAEQSAGYENQLHQASLKIMQTEKLVGELSSLLNAENQRCQELSDQTLSKEAEINTLKEALQGNE